MYEHFILWTEDEREGLSDPRKVILEVEEPHRLEGVIKNSLSGGLFEMNSIRRNLQSMILKLNLYLGANDFDKEFGSSTVYRVNFIPSPRSYVRVAIEENRLSDRFFSDIHYLWNRMFELGFLKDNKKPLGEKEVHDNLYWTSGVLSPQKLITRSDDYSLHAFATILMLETLVERSLNNGFPRVR